MSSYYSSLASDARCRTSAYGIRVTLSWLKRLCVYFFNTACLDSSYSQNSSEQLQ